VLHNKLIRAIEAGAGARFARRSPSRRRHCGISRSGAVGGQVDMAGNAGRNQSGMAWEIQTGIAGEI
jgi:hypothetical protein